MTPEKVNRFMKFLFFFLLGVCTAHVLKGYIKNDIIIVLGIFGILFSLAMLMGTSKWFDEFMRDIIKNLKG